MLLFGIVQIFLSQIPNLHNINWLSVLAAIMSFAYCFIGMGLSIMQIIGMHHHLSNLIALSLSLGLAWLACAWTLAWKYILDRLLVSTPIHGHNFPIFPENGYAKGSIEGVSTSSGTQKLWLVSQALGDVSFSYPFSTIIMEIQVSTSWFSDNKVAPKEKYELVWFKKMYYVFIVTFNCKHITLFLLGVLLFKISTKNKQLFYCFH